MFIPLKMVLIGIDPNLSIFTPVISGRCPKCGPSLIEVAACVPCQRKALAHVRANAAMNHEKERRVFGRHLWTYDDIWIPYGGFLIHGGSPSYHPF